MNKIFEFPAHTYMSNSSLRDLACNLCNEEASKRRYLILSIERKKNIKGKKLCKAGGKWQMENRELYGLKYRN